MEQDTVRLQKYFTDCGVLSRRAAEEEIAAGRVTVNGITAAIGDHVTPGMDTVAWNGKPVVKIAAQHTYLLLNKPRGYVTTLKDEKGRKTVAELVKSCGTRVYPVGRLDFHSDGLLLMTDDGNLTNRLTHPRHEIPKYYRVTVTGSVSGEALARLTEPFLLDGYQTRPVQVIKEQENAGCTTLVFELFEGRNRQIRRMCDQVGLKIARLTRFALGNIQMGALPQGTWRHLTPDEVAYLKGE